MAIFEGIWRWLKQNKKFGITRRMHMFPTTEWLQKNIEEIFLKMFKCWSWIFLRFVLYVVRDNEGDILLWICL